ncbi:GatB/YqeY domain-containing protein [Aquirhabdus parva]|uniref:GatB/YqeY domain-containing protein n=1 Tax=Aquirhabdus parva TaxID=2283318 RepID=A0A345P626_9GAMM|nr:GatB/YqeY domain-containing protein [Aquirhabdus parva]AXI02735.1 GatB/YqeY domain-containing protein [Aquirhabdus parva]
MSELKLRLTESVKSAMRERLSDRLSVLRGVQAAIKQIEVDTREELDDARVLALLEKQLKQRKESISAYTNAGRDDLAQKEQFELEVISEFLPVAMTSEELEALIANEITAQGATSIRDMGKVMNALRPLIAGRADASDVSARIKAKLSV